ncbi:PilZ domain-containing protein [Sphingomonas bacterium]|uniref:PilZ domain-containing protein n=1 Tax=Sphingomonas bacterium TaxID=1895847 RepID=UPI0015757AA8|nr:PilZ domain-containing protein [Sphingomonas bacterium]
MFAAEFEPAQNGNRRGAPRAPLSLDAGLGIGGLARTLCKVVDISISGARLQSYSALKKGSTIWLTLPDIGQIAADVMWADDYVAGCQFHRPLDPAAFEDLLEHHAPGMR